MKRARSQPQDSLSPEDLLERAMAARSAVSRARLARRGLATDSPLDPVTQSMLLRQLYLAHFEQRHFRRAVEIAEQALALDTLPDVCHQDAARALVQMGDIDGAADHLRLAARCAPARRRSFHLWTLGSVLFLAGRLEEAQAALTRAVRWSTTDRPLTAGHLALVRLERSEPVHSLNQVIDQLASAPCGQGYGQFVLGLLSAHAGRVRDAERYLRAFIERTRNGRPAVAISLSAELAMAEQRLAALEIN
jgi:tetratricopeptide (TPR) repeat protein